MDLCQLRLQHLRHPLRTKMAPSKASKSSKASKVSDRQHAREEEQHELERHSPPLQDGLHKATPPREPGASGDGVGGHRSQVGAPSREPSCSGGCVGGHRSEEVVPSRDRHGSGNGAGGHRSQVHGAPSQHHRQQDPTLERHCSLAVSIRPSREGRSVASTRVAMLSDGLRGTLHAMSTHRYTVVEKLSAALVPTLERPYLHTSRHLLVCGILLKCWPKHMHCFSFHQKHPGWDIGEPPFNA